MIQCTQWIKHPDNQPNQSGDIMTTKTKTKTESKTKIKISEEERLRKLAENANQKKKNKPIINEFNDEIQRIKELTEISLKPGYKYKPKEEVK